jgi:ribosome biogenesis GTPase
VAAHAGQLSAIICITKVDLDDDGVAEEYLDLYRAIGYTAIGASTVSGEGIDELRSQLRDKVTLLVGQSGVGKSTLLNVIQPALRRPTAPVSEATEKGRHTTTTAEWLPLDLGGAVVDTPGIRALDVAMVPLSELEMHFVEFIDLIPQCRFPDCVHIHEEGCAIKAALQAGRIDDQRYESYMTLFMERSDQGR